MRFVVIPYLVAIVLLANCPVALAQDRAPYDVPPGVGATNPAVNQGNVKTTICVSGWSTKQRPDVSVTEPLKLKLLKASSYTDKNPHHYELDHAISIEIGGAPNNAKNLWNQYSLGACNSHDKDKVEDKLHALVCHGQITLAQAQADVLDWRASYRKYIGPLSCPDGK